MAPYGLTRNSLSGDGDAGGNSDGMGDLGGGANGSGGGAPGAASARGDEKIGVEDIGGGANDSETDTRERFETWNRESLLDELIFLENLLFKTMDDLDEANKKVEEGWDEDLYEAYFIQKSKAGWLKMILHKRLSDLSGQEDLLWDSKNWFCGLCGIENSSQVDCCIDC